MSGDYGAYLHRAPDPGAGVWLGPLENGSLGFGALAVDLLTSGEFSADAAAAVP